ncbi:unnamed protein product [Rhizoctonia solani]|uniref:Uncharacterized protein n=1 Tax=Rhizoctonia solani TaxID=456999 RepID=A0A8H3EC83_9AGAM|nr:unnamed protein product [Rhizoctonia solani]
MGRKKGGKNPEGHKAGGARMGAGRPRKAGPLTLKAAIRAHAHQPTDHTILVRRDSIHPALQAFVDVPANYVLRCCNCGHSDPTKLLESSPSLSAAEENPSTSPNPFSRSQSPRLTGEPLSAVSVDFGHRDDTSSLFTPPQSLSPGGSSISDPDHIHSALSPDESVVSHAESLLMLTGSTASTPSITIPAVHQAYDLEQQELTPAASHPHSHISVMQSNHLAQSPISYNQAYIPDYLPQNNVHPDQFTNPGPDPQSPYRMYNSQPEPHFTPTSTTPPSFPGPSEPPLPSPQQTYYSPQQTRPPDFSPQAQHFYAPGPSYSEQQPDMYFPQAQALQQPQHIKPGPAAWRHAPHSTSIPPAVAAILPPQHTHPQQQLDSTGPVQFLPTGQHTQRRRRRCVICIGAGRGDEADRCCGRGNRHLCPLYSKHGSPENIMEIRNAKHVRPTAT